MAELINQLDPVFDRVSSSRLTDPGPTGKQIELLISAAMTAPDHGKLRPWRFTIFAGESRHEFGKILTQALTRRLNQAGQIPTSGQTKKEEAKLLRAPVVIVVSVALDTASKIPQIEQISSGAAACENMLIAATAMGIGSMWRTGEPTYDPSIKESLGLQTSDHIVGWLYFGTPPEQARRPKNPDDISKHYRYWSEK